MHASLILLQCIREPRQKDPPKQSPVTFMQGPPPHASLENCWWSSSLVNSAALQADQGLLQRLMAMLLWITLIVLNDRVGGPAHNERAIHLHFASPAKIQRLFISMTGR
jgi:hypothetical protein